MEQVYNMQKAGCERENIFTFYYDFTFYYFLLLGISRLSRSFFATKNLSIFLFQINRETKIFGIKCLLTCLRVKFFAPF